MTDNIEDIWQYLREVNTDWSERPMQKIPEETINTAKKIYESMPEKFSVFPTGRSTVQMDYHSGNMYLSAEVFEDSILTMFVLNDEPDSLEQNQYYNTLEAIQYMQSFFVV